MRVFAKMPSDSPGITIATFLRRGKRFLIKSDSYDFLLIGKVQLTEIRGKLPPQGQGTIKEATDSEP